MKKIGIWKRVLEEVEPMRVAWEGEGEKGRRGRKRRKIVG